jgi:polyisoprenoid-binding protein YceI
MKKSILLAAFALATVAGIAQKRTTTSAVVNFDATTAIDALPKAENKTVIAALDPTKGTVAFEATIKSFSFTNPMIQEHFNGKKWMDSETYPTAVFKGNITNLDKLDLSKDGKYVANIEGDLTMHGVTKPVKTTATIQVDGKTMTASAEFTVSLEDYQVSGGAIAAGKVAKDPKISVLATF